jgi:hypothetical protein
VLDSVSVRVLVFPIPAIVHNEPGGRHAGAQDRLGRDRIAGHRKTTERGPQFLERQTRIEKCAEHHVSRYSGEAVQVEHA